MTARTRWSLAIVVLLAGNALAMAALAASAASGGSQLVDGYGGRSLASVIVELSETMGGGDPAGSAGGAGGNAPRGIVELSGAVRPR